jgi:hypothetical protein
MVYEAPAVEQREPIGVPFVVGSKYVLSPTWTDQPDDDKGGA